MSKEITIDIEGSQLDSDLQEFLDIVSETFEYNGAAIVQAKDKEGNDVYLLTALVGDAETEGFKLYPIGRLFKEDENPYDHYTPVPDGIKAVQQPTLKSYEEQTGEKLVDPETDQRYS